MVCLGNICRSPLAEGILKEKVKGNQLDWLVDSAGTGHWHAGERPDARSIAVAAKYNINITDQRARQFSAKDFNWFDIIYTMDEENYKNVLRLAKTEAEKKKVRMILNEIHPSKNLSVPDPYWDDDGFEKVFQMLNEACEVIVRNSL